MKSKIYLLIFLVPFLLLLNQCAKCDDPSNPECSNYNPCYIQKRTSANFTISENDIYDGMWREYDTDTILGRFGVNFKALIDTHQTKFEWHIGAGVYYTPNVYLTFGSVKTPTHIPVTLIVRKTPNTKCFPDDDGIDTATRLLHVYPKDISKIRVWGTYYGYYTNNPAKFYTVYVKRMAPESDTDKKWIWNYCSDTATIISGGWGFTKDGITGNENLCLEYYAQRELTFRTVGRDAKSGNIDAVANVLVDSIFNEISIKFNGTLWISDRGDGRDTTFEFIGKRLK